MANDRTTNAEGVALPELPATAPAAAPTPADYREEWTQWVATGPLYVDGALAVAPGGPVPASHPLLEQWKQDGSVTAAPKPEQN